MKDVFVVLVPLDATNPSTDPTNQFGLCECYDILAATAVVRALLSVDRMFPRWTMIRVELRDDSTLRP